MNDKLCHICHKPIGEKATTICVKDRLAHFDCATKNPEAFAEMMWGKKALAQRKEGE